MPNAANSFVGGDGHVDGGYGTLKKAFLGADSEAERGWPYKMLSDLEKSDDDYDDEESEETVSKKVKPEVPSDRLGQLNYKPHSYVNGSTRGLTGIMSGMDPRAILEQFIDEVNLKRRKGDASGSIMGQKPIGLGAPQLNMMHPSGSSRTRPGAGLGSKQGWFGAPPPKETDPSNVDSKYSLRDIALADEDRPLRHVDTLLKRVKQKNNRQKENNAVLKSYVRNVSKGA